MNKCDKCGCDPCECDVIRTNERAAERLKDDYDELAEHLKHFLPIEPDGDEEEPQGPAN